MIRHAMEQKFHSVCCVKYDQRMQLLKQALKLLSNTNSTPGVCCRRHTQGCVETARAGKPSPTRSHECMLWTPAHGG